MKGPGHLPLFSAEYPVATLGYGKYVTVSQTVAAMEVLAPLPGSALRLPLSLSSTLCSSFGYSIAPSQRNFTAGLVVTVAGRTAMCSGSNPAAACLVTYDTTAYPIILSVIPNQGASPVTVACFARASVEMIPCSE